MAYSDSLFPFLVLSWKWYLFGLTLLVLNLSYLRVDRQKGGDTSKIDLSITSQRAWQFGIVLGFFSLLLSAPSQWVFVTVGFLLGAILGLVLGINAKREIVRGHSSNTWFTAWRQSLPAIFSIFVGMVALVILSKRLPYAQGLLLSIWSGAAAFLIFLNLLVWLHMKHQRPTA